MSFGANLAAVDEDGDNALHLVVRNTNPQYKLPTDESPEIKKVSESFSIHTRLLK